MESTLGTKVQKYIEKKGWQIHPPGRIRGRVPDFIFSKNGKIGIVEVRGEKANIDNAIGQALHFKKAVNLSYLALPKRAVTSRLKDLCKTLGIGLFIVDEKVNEIIKPIETNALDSIKEKLRIPVPEKEPLIKKRSSLERLFRTSTLVLVLKLLLWNSNKEYHLAAISDMVGVSASTVYKELESIYLLSIVTRTKKGSMVIYKINKNSIIYDDLRKIFLKLELADEIIAKEMLRDDIKYALIFGSFAKGTQTESSDVDLLVVGAVKHDIIHGIISKLEVRIGREINVIVWTEDEFKEKSKQRVALLQNIAKDPIIMVKGDEKEFTRSIK